MTRKRFSAEQIVNKLRDKLFNGEIFYSLREAKVLIECWRRHYNKIRPHSALGYRPPAPESIMLPIRRSVTMDQAGQHTSSLLT